MGYLRFRRSIKLGPGIKLNLNKRSAGLTVGARGAHYSMNTRGQRTTTVGLPGTGLSYINRSTGTRPSPDREQGALQALPVAEPSQPRPSHPGLFARHHERMFFEGTQRLEADEIEPALAAFVDADQSDDKHRAISPALLAGILSHQLSRPAQAIPYLERVTRSAQPLPDQLMTKYAANLTVRINVGEHVSMPLQVDSVSASMVLAECYRDVGRLQEAIGLMQQLFDHVPAAPILLALCTLYREAEEWDEIVHVTAGLTNEDDITLMIRLFQAEAMEKQDLPDAALEIYRDALKSKHRDPEMLKDARYARATLCLRVGRKAQAKRDLARLYVDDPDYEDVQELLTELER